MTMTDAWVATREAALADGRLSPDADALIIAACDALATILDRAEVPDPRTLAELRQWMARVPPRKVEKVAADPMQTLFDLMADDGATLHAVP